MPPIDRRPFLLMAVAALISTLSVTASSAQTRDLTRDAAERFLQKIAHIAENALTAGQRPRLTPVQEVEVNAYLRHGVVDRLPPALREPAVTLHGEGRLSGRAIVDLDELRKEQAARTPEAEDGWLDAMSYLSGRIPIAATGILHTQEGIGRLELESVAISGVPVPVSLLRQLVRQYSRTSDTPEGIDLDTPFALPAQVQEIRVEPGEAVVVQ